MTGPGKAADRALRKLATSGVAAQGEVLETLLAEGLVRREQERLALTASGRARLARLGNGEHPHLAQHAELERRRIDDADVLVDISESPLAWLAKRRGKDGRPLIAPAAFQAGERFRAHVTLAGTVPRVTTNWSDPMGRSPRSASGVADLTDAVLSAQQKVSRALEAVGPELSGVLLDVCAFLKGLEEVERERGWPARTAKVVLGLALDRLAGHYGLGEEARGRGGFRTIRTWKADES